MDKIMYFFEDREKQRQLGDVLESWLGTPYRHWAGVKGMGADCIHFVARVFEEVGVLSRVAMPCYAPDWHLHRGRELLLDRLRQHPQFEEVDTESSLNGDVFLLRFGKADSHAVIYFNGHIYHSANQVGVVKTHWEDQKLYRRKRHAFRVRGQA